MERRELGRQLGRWHGTGEKNRNTEETEERIKNGKEMNQIKELLNRGKERGDRKERKAKEEKRQRK